MSEREYDQKLVESQFYIQNLFCRLGVGVWKLLVHEALNVWTQLVFRYIITYRIEVDLTVFLQLKHDS